MNARADGPAAPAVLCCAAVKKVNLWQKHPDLAPAWFR